MRRLVTVVATLLAMLAAAGVGAFVAAHSTPRDRPGIGGGRSGAAPSPSPSGSGQQGAERWHGVMISRTSRAYRSGGTCTTDWRVLLHFDVDGAGGVSGRGRAHLTSGPNCPFVTGQPQVRSYGLQLAGSRTKQGIELRVAAQSTGPGIDYGGFGSVFGQSGRTITLPVHKESTTALDGRGRAVLKRVPADATDMSIARNSLRLSAAAA
ncbi:MAG: hypothetical protein M3O88_03560 [Actinomycetota bacterium]|nr:hypothetical protein [Actinomycetota bacterium]